MARASRGSPRALLAVLGALALSACAGQGGVPSAMWSWNRPFAPYRVIGNVYYVGSNQIAQFLVTTPAGHILLDSGFEASVPRLRANVEALGFRFEDVKLLLTSHAHIDHVQGHALVRRLTGAAVVDSARDGAIVAAGGQGESVYDGVYAWTPCPVDRVVADGDRVELGGTTLTAHLTPGHTKGCTTWTMKVQDSGKSYDVVIVGSPNVNDGYKLVNNAAYPQIASDYERGFQVLKSLHCDVFLGAHGDYYGMEAKYARIKDSGANPFIDPDGYKNYLNEREAAFRAELAKQRGVGQ